MTTQYHSDPLNEAIRVVLTAFIQGPDRLLTSHKQLWAELWKNDIIIEGNNQDQK